MSNQKGGVYVKLTPEMQNQLHEVRTSSGNNACGACAVNSMGLSEDIVLGLRDDAERDDGVTRHVMLQALRNYADEVTSDWSSREIISNDGREIEWIYSENFKDYIITNRNKQKLKKWLKKNIPSGYATVIFIPGHFTVIGKTAVHENLFIIEPQQGGEEGYGSEYDVDGTGIYEGDEQVIKYLADNHKNQCPWGGHRYYIPKPGLLLGAGRTQHIPDQGEIFYPSLGRQMSMLSQEGEDLYSDDPDTQEHDDWEEEEEDYDEVPQAPPVPQFPRAPQAPPVPRAPQAPPVPRAPQAPPVPRAPQAPPMIPPAHVPILPFRVYEGRTGTVGKQFIDGINYINNFIENHQNKRAIQSKSKILEGISYSIKFGNDNIQYIIDQDIRQLIIPAYEQAIRNLQLLNSQTAGGINLKELMKPGTKVKPGKFALKK